MDFPPVVNARETREGFYIGRAFAGFAASPFLNPFSVGQDTFENRIAAVWRFTRWFFDQPQRLDLAALSAKPCLICWCAPKFCHGHALQWMLDQMQLPGQPCRGCGKTIEHSILNGHQISKVEAIVVNEHHKCACGHYGYARRLELRPETIAAWVAERE